MSGAGSANFDRVKVKELMGKIVFWRTLAAAYRLTFGDLRRLVRLSEPWLTVIAGVYVIAAGLALITEPAVALDFWVFAWVLLALCGFACFAVAWQRAILIGDAPAGRATFRIGRREWRLLGYTLGSALIVGGAMTLASLPLRAAAGLAIGTNVDVVAGADLIVMLGGLLGFGRLALVLPAVASDETGPMLARAWARGRGNTLRLTFGPLIGYVSIGVVAVAYGELAFLVAGDDLTLLFLLQLPLVPVSFLQIAVPLAFLCLAYRQLVGLRA